MSVWLIIMLITFAINTFFGCYIYRRVSKLADTDPTQHPKWNPALNYSRNTLNISMDFWLNDPVVCLHIVLSIFAIAWAIVGLSWASNAMTCPSELKDASTAAGIIMLVFIGFGLLMIVTSLCTGYMEHCFNDCNFIHCLCCCFYYPFFYHYDPNYEGPSARQYRERRQMQAGQHQQLVNSPKVTIQQPPMAQPVMGVPLGQPVYQQQHPAVVVQPVMQQPTYGATGGGYMQAPQPQQDYQRRSFQATPSATPAQTEPDNIDKAKQKAAAVAEATGEKLKEGAQMLKAWWDKPKDNTTPAPRN